MKAEAKISPKSCATSDTVDFQPVNLFGSDIFLEGYDPSGNATCMQLDHVWVMHR